MSENAFKYSVLASGSTGNSFYVETPQKRLLIDAGLTGKKITSLLADIDRKPEDLDAILITTNIPTILRVLECLLVVTILMFMPMKKLGK